MGLLLMNDWNVKEFWRYKRDMSPNEQSWFTYYIRKFKRLAISIYEWDNLPETVDPYLIEKYLFENGRCIIWNDPKFGMVVARVEVTQWDAWKKPLKVRPVYDGIPNVQPEQDINDVVYITDLFDYDGTRKDAFYLVSELICIQNIIDTQNTNQATPLMAIGGNTKTKDKLKNCILTIANGLKVMFVEDDITNNLKPLNLNSVYNVPTLMQYKKEVENEILSYLGVDSQQAYQKKERMIVDEQEGNDELLNYFLADGLKARQRAIDNNLIGFNASVAIQGFVRPEMTDDIDGNGNFKIEDNDKVCDTNDKSE